MTNDAFEDAPPPSNGAERPGLVERSRRRRQAKWEHRPDRTSWRWWVSITGRILIAAGLLLFGFIAYQLWGTGLETARAQRSLAQEFEAVLEATPTTTTPTTTVATTEPPTTTTPPEPNGEPDPEPEPEPAPEPSPEPAPAPAPAPAPEPIGVDQPFGPIETGDPIAKLEIPRIEVEDIVVAGVGVPELQRGPGHFADTPLPGQLGNASVAGHRTTYGAPFRNVDRLEPGDEIVVTTIAGRFTYLVTGTTIVSPQDYQVVATVDDEIATLTLVSCHPLWSAAQRIIVSAELDPERSDPVGNPIRYGLETTETELPSEDVDDAAASGDDAATSGEPVVTVDGNGDGNGDGDGDDDADGSSDDNSTTDTTVVPGDDSSVDDGDIATTLPASGDDDPTATGAIDRAGASSSPSIEEAFGRGWFHDRDAFPQIALWGGLLTLIAIASYALSRAVRRDLVGFAVGVVPFAFAAFFFFQNVNRLLPPNL